jgi:hypothetical protein
MILVTIEMLPGGDPKHPRRRLLQQIAIANVGGDHKTGHYDVVIPKSPEYAKSAGIWKRGRVTGFPRLRLGPADLLLRALVACVGDRNKSAVTDLAARDLDSPPDAEATA